MTNKTVSISFIDTNKEFADFIIKPWIYACAHRGLIETSDTSLPTLKCNIVASFFAKSSPDAQTTPNAEKAYYKHREAYYNKTFGTVSWTNDSREVLLSTFNESEPYLRKVIHFKNCIPVSLDSKSYDFSAQYGSEAIMSTVNFSFDYFVISYDSIPGTTDIEEIRIVSQSPEGTKTSTSTSTTGEIQINQTNYSGTINLNTGTAITPNNVPV